MLHAAVLPRGIERLAALTSHCRCRNKIKTMHPTQVSGQSQDMVLLFNANKLVYRQDLLRLRVSLQLLPNLLLAARS